jgi:hypothetical protein
MKTNVKVKLFLCTVLWHLGELRCSFTGSQLQQYMEVSGQIHTSYSIGFVSRERAIGIH